ncbi:MAG: MerR family transcriptional regulator [Bacillota bacterium]
MRIGELARQSGLTIRTVRYYEERGLLHPVGRTQGNYRLYNRESLKLLQTIRRCKKLGMSLDDILELKDLYARNNGDCTGQLREKFLRLVQDRIQQIDHEIAELTLLREEISFHYQRLKEFLGCQTNEELNQICRNALYISPEPVFSAPVCH